MKRISLSRLSAAGIVTGAALVATTGTSHAVSPTPSTPEPQGGDGYCSVNVCMDVASGQDGFYSVRAYFRPSAGGSSAPLPGHFDFRGPGLDQSSDYALWPMFNKTIWYGGRGVGEVCVEGWSNHTGQWRSLGVPCAPTH